MTGETSVDGRMKTWSELLNIDYYTKKKTLAQGCLDLALLLANASQLRFILTTEDYHPYYTFLLWLISFSIGIQFFQAFICVVLGLIFNIKRVDQHETMDIINNVSAAFSIVVVALNIVISAFDIKSDGIQGGSNCTT